MAPPTGVREAHAHIASHGRALAMPDLAACGSVAECLDMLGARGAAALPGAWILAHGARPESWAEARWPSLAELDRALPRHPCAVMSFDHHAVVANSAALAAAGILPDSPDHPGGVICRDPRSGALTGLVLESSARAVWGAAPEPTPRERRAHVEAALADLGSHGFDEVNDMLAPPWLGPMLAEIHDAGRLALRVNLFVPIDDLESAAAGAPSWQRPGLELAGGKVFADGTLNSRTAWMLHDYVDPMRGMPRGKALLTVDEIARAIDQCAARGLRLAAHAIGDGAVRACLDAAERAVRPRGGAVPLRIEHAEIIDEADLARFAALGVVASVQPCHLLYDGEALRRYLPHRLHRVLPLRDLIDSGCRPGEGLQFGSDVPIVRPHPADSVQAATARRREGRPGGESIAPEQAVSVSEAWRAFAAGA